MVRSKGKSDAFLFGLGPLFPSRSVLPPSLSFIFIPLVLIILFTSILLSRLYMYSVTWPAICISITPERSRQEINRSTTRRGSRNSRRRRSNSILSLPLTVSHSKRSRNSTKTTGLEENANSPAHVSDKSRSLRGGVIARLATPPKPQIAYLRFQLQSKLFKCVVVDV